MCAEAKRGRQLLQTSPGPINNFTVSVMVTKCSGTQPVDTASVAAIINGYTATNLRIPLSPTTRNPSLYSGELRLCSMRLLLLLLRLGWTLPSKQLIMHGTPAAARVCWCHVRRHGHPAEPKQSSSIGHAAHRASYPTQEAFCSSSGEYDSSDATVMTM